MHHYQPRPGISRRRHSPSDLNIEPCDCYSDRPRDHTELRGIVATLRTLDLNRTNVAGDNDFVDDYPEEEDAEDDSLYDGSDE